MKVCIYGAGAIGGYLGAALARAQGTEVTLIARGPHLAAIRERGLTLIDRGEEYTVHPAATDNPEDAGPQDFVVVSLKAHQAWEVADRMAPLLGPDTAVVTCQNGVPWWYFYKLDGPYENHKLDSIDPGGKFWDAVGPERAIGFVVYPAAEIAEPGVIRHIEGNRYTMGEPDGRSSDRTDKLCAALKEAGFKSRVRDNIRDDIWIKLWGNLCFNPISVLTHATLEQMGRDEGVRDVIRQTMVEARDVALKLGVNFSMDIEKRIDAGVNVGAHKTSMLQDFEQGRPLELDALVASVSEMGRLVDVPTPTIDAMLALVQLRVSVDS